MFPIYRLTINDNDDTGVEFNAMVDVPAHLKKWDAFGRKQVRIQYVADKPKRVVRGVMISVGTPIYRRDPEIGEHYVYFDKETVDKIVKKFHRQKLGDKVNEMHNSRRVLKGVNMFESFQIDRAAGIFPPKSMEDMNLQDGTWVAAYEITDNRLWKKVENGTFQGFSVEGLFERSSVSVKHKLRQMKNKNKRTIWDRFLGTESFASVVAADGTELFYEGDLAEKTPVFVEVDGTQIAAPTGTYEITDADGAMKTVTVDDNGLVSAIAETEAAAADDFSEELEEALEGVKEETAQAMRDMFSGIHKKFNAQAKEIAELREQIAAGAPGTPEKKKQTHRNATDPVRKTWRDL